MRARLLPIAFALMAISFDTFAAPVFFQLLNSTFTAPEASLLAGDVTKTATIGTRGDTATFDLDLAVGNAAGDVGTLATPNPYTTILSGLLQFFTGRTLGDTLKTTHWETEVYFKATLALAGDPGARALVTGSFDLEGSRNHQIAVGSPLWLSTGSAYSSVSGTTEVFFPSEPYSENLSLGASHVDKVAYPFPPDFSNVSLGSVTRNLDAFDMIVGDPLAGIMEIGALFIVSSTGTVDPACTHFIITICDPTSGYSIAMTKGSFALSLEAQPIPNPVPEPPTFALICVGLLSVVGSLRYSRRRN
jgi:hypothetical protein